MVFFHILSKLYCAYSLIRGLGDLVGLYRSFSSQCYLICFVYDTLSVLKLNQRIIMGANQRRIILSKTIQLKCIEGHLAIEG